MGWPSPCARRRSGRRNRTDVQSRECRCLTRSYAAARGKGGIWAGSSAAKAIRLFRSVTAVAGRDDEQAAPSEWREECAGNVRDRPSATVRDEPPARPRESDFAHGCARPCTPASAWRSRVRGFDYLRRALHRRTEPDVSAALSIRQRGRWPGKSAVAIVLASAFSSAREAEGLQQRAGSRVGVDRVGSEPEPFRDLQNPEGLFRALLGRHHVSPRRCEIVAPQEFPRTCPLNRPRRCAGSNLPPPLRVHELHSLLAVTIGARGERFPVGFPF
jgi:hypothetical protein